MFPHNNCFAISRRLIWERNIFCFFVLTFSLSLVFFFPKRNRPCLTHAPVKDKCFIRQETCSFFFFLLFLFRDFFFLLQFFFGQFDRLPCHLKKNNSHTITNEQKYASLLSQFHQYFFLSLSLPLQKILYLLIYTTHTCAHAHAHARAHTQARIGKGCKILSSQILPYQVFVDI